MVPQFGLKGTRPKIARRSDQSDPNSLYILPNELLIRIAEHVLPDDITNFSASCRLLRELARPSLETHRLRRKVYTSVHVGETSKVLFSICARSWIALYPKCLTIEVDNNPCKYWNPNEENDSGLINESSESKALEAEFRAIAKRIPFLSAEKLEPWLLPISYGKKDAMISFVLATLPNIEELSISVVQYRNLGTTTRLLESLIYWGARHQQHRVLPMLSKLRLNHQYDRNFREVETLDVLMPFMALPSLRTVAINHAISRNIQPSICKSRCSEVTQISLHDSAVSGESLRRLLGCCTRLKLFEYSPGCANMHSPRRSNMLAFGQTASGIDWDPRIVRDALLTSANSTLEGLKITDDFARPRQPIGSLSGFTTLKSLMIDIDMLSTGDPVFATWKLKKLLPASLVCIILRGVHHDIKDHWKLAERLQLPGKEGLKSLRRVSVHCNKGKTHVYHLWKPSKSMQGSGFSSCI